MKLYEMFIGRDAKSADVATFMYIFLFGNKVPSVEMAQDHLERLNGPLNRLRILFRELVLVIEGSDVSIV